MNSMNSMNSMNRVPGRSRSRSHREWHPVTGHSEALFLRFPSVDMLDRFVRDGGPGPGPV